MGQNETSIESGTDAAPDDGNSWVELVKRAQDGDREVLPKLRAMFEDDGGKHVEKFGNIERFVESALLARLASKNLAIREGLERKLAKLRDELAGPAASPIERLLAERATFCWLTVYDYERDYAESGNITLKQADYHQRRINAAHRRFLSALKTLASIRKLGLPAIQVSIAVNEMNVAKPR